MPCLILVGHHCAGKTTAAQIIARRANATRLEVGDAVTRDFLTCSECEDCEFVLYHADHVFATGDYSRFVRAVAEEAPTHGPIIVVGPRTPQEVQFLKARFLNSISVGLRVTTTERLKRFRRRFHDSAAVPSLNLRDRVEFSWGAETTLTQCEYSVDATVSAEVVADQILSIWREHGLETPTSDNDGTLGANQDQARRTDG